MSYTHGNILFGTESVLVKSVSIIQYKKCTS